MAQGRTAIGPESADFGIRRPEPFRRFSAERVQFPVRRKVPQQHLSLVPYFIWYPVCCDFIEQLLQEEFSLQNSIAALAWHRHDWCSV
jgi:hypothetical protein